MRLYEFVVGDWCGESYVRFYVRAVDDDRANHLAESAVHGTRYAGANLKKRFLYDEALSSFEFFTEPSDSGWQET